MNKYILTGTYGKYVVGDFDGISFIQTSEIKQFSFGDTYSSQTWNNIPNTNNAIIIFRLGDMEDPNKKSQMSIPIKLTLDTDDTLKCEPIINILKYVYYEMHNQYIDNISVYIPSPIFILTISFKKDKGNTLIEFADGIFKYDHENSEISYNEYNVKLDNKNDIKLDDNNIDLQIISDLYSIEFFICNKKYIGCFQYGNIFSHINFKNIQVLNLKLSTNEQYYEQ
jgi:phage anti-repressor protein